MDYCVYAIKSKKDGRVYVGISQNPNKRLLEHNAGQTFSTKGFRPYILLYQEQCNNRQEARLREKYWKSGTGKEKLKAF